MPHATAPGCHVPVNGTNTLIKVKCTYVSARIATTWTPVKIRARPPRKRCRSNSHAGLGWPPITRVDRASPQMTEAAARPHATMPAARAAYHVICDVIGLALPRPLGPGFGSTGRLREGIAPGLRSEIPSRDRRSVLRPSPCSPG